MKETIEEACADGRFVAFDREGFAEIEEVGRIVAVGDTLFVLAQLSDGLRPAGFSILRIEDVSDLELPYAHEGFVESTLRLRGETVGPAPALDLSSWTTAIRDAGRLAEVVTLHTEESDAGTCRIGHVRSVDDARVQLVEIDPDADWAEEPSEMAIDSVTRVDVGGEYEEALVLVGGRCPRPRLRAVE